MLSSILLASMNVYTFPINILCFVLLLILSEQLLLVLVSPNNNKRWKAVNQLSSALYCFTREMELTFFLLSSFYFHCSRLLQL